MEGHSQRSNRVIDAQLGLDEDDDEEEEFLEEEEVDVPSGQDPDQEIHDAYEAGDLGARARPAKRPVRRRLNFEEVQQAELPGNGDLGEFFGDIHPKQQIAICRAYASYLAAQSRARKPGYPQTYIARNK